MKIEGNTITFKSTPGNFSAEVTGNKCCTVRVLSYEEDSEMFAAFENEFRQGEKKRIRIIMPGIIHDVCFERNVTNITRIGEILNHFIFEICWKHKEEEE